MVIEESLVSILSPFSLHRKSVLGSFLKTILSLPQLFFPPSTGDSLDATDCVSGFPPFGHLIYDGLAGPH